MRIAMAPLVWMSTACSVACACERGVPDAKKSAVEPVTPSVQSAAPVPAPPPQVVAPFTVLLQAPAKLPKGPVEIVLEIDSAKGFQGETEITAQLPKGAKLTAGEANEKLAGLPEGKTTRTFEVLAAKLSPADPVRIIVEGRDPKGTFGARAERVYPEPGAE